MGETPAQEAHDGQRSPLGFDAREYARSAHNHHGPAGHDRYVGHGNLLGGGVLRKHFTVNKMMDAAIQEKAAEDETAEQEWCFHRTDLHAGWLLRFRDVCPCCLQQGLGSSGQAIAVADSAACADK